MRVGMSIATVLIVAANTGCDPCAGTPSCHMEPEVSYTGEFIERFSGRSVAGVQVEFIRRGGLLLVADTVRAVSDRDGFFVIRVGAFSEGDVVGALRVTPPEPYQPYTVEGVVLRATRKRGDGGVLGRLVVNPYLQLLGEVRNNATGAIINSAMVTLTTTNDPALVEPSVVQIATGEDGRFLWEPIVLHYGTLQARIEIVSPQHPTPLIMDRGITLQHLDGPPYFLTLNVGRTMRHVALSRRRGTAEAFAGVTAQFVRTSGIAIQPDSFVTGVGNDGTFMLTPEPLESGSTTGTLTIRPPPPFPAEVIPGVELRTRDDDVFQYIGEFGYGSAVMIRALFKHRATGEPLDSGTHVRPYRVGGLSVLSIPTTSADSGIRVLDGVGGLSYAAATADTGQVIFDIEVRFPKPAGWDTVRSVKVPSRYSDSAASILTFFVGPP